MHPQDKHVDAVDLTLSSPEPESDPQQRVSRHAQPGQPAVTSKQETIASHRRVQDRNDYPQLRSLPHSGSAATQQLRRINPQHVKQIIDTSSHRALRHIVLQLCKTSPALSGAIARGLAPHSAYAQQLIRGQQAKVQTQTRQQEHTQHVIKAESRNIEQDVCESITNRPGPTSGTQSAAMSSHTHRQPAFPENRDNLRLPPSSQKTPQVRQEHRSSHTDSDDSTNIVDFQQVDSDTLRPRPEPHSQRKAIHDPRHESTASFRAERLAVRQNVTQSSTSDRKPKLCLQCGEMFEGDMNCSFHPGRETPTKFNDIPRYTCCGKFAGEPGCNFGRHVSERTGIYTNSKRPSPSPYSGSQWPKKPRVL